MSPSSTKRIAILVEDLFEDLELHYPRIRLREAGIDVVLVGPEKRSYRGKNGLAARADVAATDIEAQELAAVVIPGGYAPDRMRRHRELVQLVRDVHDNDGIVAAICHAGWMLVSADILRQREVTSFFSIADDMRNAGARWRDAEVVRDGKLITSRTPDDLPAFCRTLLGALAET